MPGRRLRERRIRIWSQGRDCCKRKSNGEGRRDDGGGLTGSNCTARGRGSYLARPDDEAFPA
eukprot:1195567-Prorocentrum_minimum.AAC.3